MLLGIDHLVIAVADPDAAAAAMEVDLGLAFTGGGRHEQGGTFNRLAFVGDTYLELIGVFDRGIVLASPAAVIGRAALSLLDDGREGLATYALATDDVAREVATRHAAGSTIEGPVPGSRRRPDGEVVHWACGFPTLGPGRPPFLIEHEPVGAEWGAEARVMRAAFRHPEGGRVRLARIATPVADVAVAAAEHARDAGLTFDGDRRATVGDQAIHLVAPANGRPVVDLTAEPGTDALDVGRFGIRWRRTPRAAA